MSTVSPETAAAAPIADAISTASDGPVTTANPLSLTPLGEPLFERAEVDASTRIPVLLFFGSSILWLLFASILTSLAYFKLAFPTFLTSVPYLTVGRVLPASEDAFAYGWAASAAFGAGLWVLARLCRTPLRHGGTLSAAWILWNLGVIAGVIGIMMGHGTGFKLLNFPTFASPIIFSASVFISIWGVLMFRYRRPGPLFISQWFILAGFLWFPWTYATANLLLFFIPVEGSLQPVIHSWFLRAFGGVFFTSMALGAAYYIVPKVMGRTVYRYGLSKVALWGTVLCFSWSGAFFLIGGPVPAWLTSLSIVANTLLLVPAFCAFVNLRGTLETRTLALRHSPSLRFVITGVACFLASIIMSAFIGFRSVNALARFTLLMNAQDQLAMYAFVSFVLFGAVYYIVPRLVELEWPSATLLRLHYWFSATGAGLVIGSFALAGILQGLGLNDAKVPMMVLTDFIRPLVLSAALCSFVILAGHVCFAASWMLIFFKVSFGVYETRRALRFSAGEPGPNRPLPTERDFASSAS